MTSLWKVSWFVHLQSNSSHSSLSTWFRLEKKQKHKKVVILSDSWDHQQGFCVTYNKIHLVCSVADCITIGISALCSLKLNWHIITINSRLQHWQCKYTYKWVIKYPTYSVNHIMSYILTLSSMQTINHIAWAMIWAAVCRKYEVHIYRLPLQ